MTNRRATRSRAVAAIGVVFAFLMVEGVSAQIQYAQLTFTNGWDSHTYEGPTFQFLSPTCYLNMMQQLRLTTSSSLAETIRERLSDAVMESEFGTVVIIPRLAEGDDDCDCRTDDDCDCCRCEGDDAACDPDGKVYQCDPCASNTVVEFDAGEFYNDIGMPNPRDIDPNGYWGHYRAWIQTIIESNWYGNRLTLACDPD